LHDLVPYEPAYLAGHKAQRYQIGLEQGFETAKQAMAPAIEQDVRRDIGGDEQRVHSIDTRYDDISFKHLLLPVWVSAYRYDKRAYQVLVNARTGEVQGDRPYSFWKIAGAIVAALVLIATVYLFVNANRSSSGGVDYGASGSPTIVSPAAPPAPRSGSGSAGDPIRPSRVPKIAPTKPPKPSGSKTKPKGARPPQPVRAGATGTRKAGATPSKAKKTGKTSGAPRSR
jgi:hypothetical protein